MHLYQLLIALVTHRSYLLCYEHSSAYVQTSFWFRGISRTPCITCYVAFWKQLLLVIFMNLSANGCTFLCLNVMNKTRTSFQINGQSTRHRYILTATCSRPPQFYFLGYGCLNDSFICFQYVYKISTYFQLSQEGKFLNRNLSTNYQMDTQDHV